MYCSHLDITILEKLDLRRSMAWKKYFSFHDSMNIVQYMITCIIKKHANDREWCNILTEILHKTIYPTISEKIFKASQPNQFVSLIS